MKHVEGPIAPRKRSAPGRVGLAERGRVVRPLSGLEAAVAIPVLPHPDGGLTAVVSRRAHVNGRTGGPMSHAGEVVLLGGAMEARESPAEAALREESGTAERLTDADLSVLSPLDTWVTESGYLVHGFVIAAPWELSTAQPDPREVHELIRLPVHAAYAAQVRHAFHAVRAEDRAGVLPPADVGDWQFESPTIRVRMRGSGSCLLWGLAGHMFVQLQRHFPDVDRLAAALAMT